MKTVLIAVVAGAVASLPACDFVANTVVENYDIEIVA